MRDATLGDEMRDPLLSMLVASVDELEAARIAAAGRLRVMVTSDPDSDGITRGLALPIDGTDAKIMRGIVAHLTAAERAAIRRLEAAMRAHPLGPWVTATHGLGHKTIARLLGALGGDPYMRADGTVRTVAQLWAYCGYHVVDGAGPRLRRGQRATWSTAARTRAYVVAERAVMQRKSPLRAVYDSRRERTRRTHPDWTDGHAHADALRIVAKRMLLGLWLQAKAWHDQNH